MRLATWMVRYIGGVLGHIAPRHQVWLIEDDGNCTQYADNNVYHSVDDMVKLAMVKMLVLFGLYRGKDIVRTVLPLPPIIFVLLALFRLLLFSCPNDFSPSPRALAFGCFVLSSPSASSHRAVLVFEAYLFFL